jgi:hypothetical protein
MHRQLASSLLQSNVIAKIMNARIEKPDKPVGHLESVVNATTVLTIAFDFVTREINEASLEELYALLAYGVPRPLPKRVKRVANKARKACAVGDFR